MLDKRNCGIFDIKSNYFGPVMLKKLKRFETLDKTTINAKTCFYKQIKNFIAMTKSRGGGVFTV